MTNRTYSTSLKRVLLAGALLLTSTAFGGYVYEFQQSEDAAGSTRLMVEGDKIRITSGGSSAADMIFDASASSMTLLEHDRKRYVNLDKATVEDIAKQIEEAMAEMEKQLASLPPAQRKMMESMMQGKMKGMGEAPPEISFDRTGETDTKSGYDVEKVIVLEDGVPARELWVADWDDVEGSAELTNGLNAMADMFNDMTKAFSKGPMAGMIGGQATSNWYGRIEEIGGMPIVASELGENGTAQPQTILSKVEEREIEASAFEVPKGYKKQKMKM